MPSTGKGKSKPALSKRPPLPRACDFTKDFEKDWARYSDSGRFDMNDLRRVMLLLIANEGPLPAHYKDHKLEPSRRRRDCRECHVHGDYLLVYRLVDNGRTVIFTAIGTHSELFGR